MRTHMSVSARIVAVVVGVDVVGVGGAAVTATSLVRNACPTVAGEAYRINFLALVYCTYCRRQ
jgi:hypothetical protein